MSWERYKKYYLGIDRLGFGLDISRVNFDDAFLPSMKGKMKSAFDAMQALENGAIANPDENRMVGHYWLRTPELAPTEEIKNEIVGTVEKIKDFAKKIHKGEIVGADGKFKYVLCIGIGGSALGPQFVSEALASPRTDKMQVFFLDNTDPDGYDVVFDKLRGKLGKTLAVIASKSGGTPEPRNAMMEAIARWESAGLDFAKHAPIKEFPKLTAIWRSIPEQLAKEKIINTTRNNEMIFFMIFISFLNFKSSKVDSLC